MNGLKRICETSCINQYDTASSQQLADIMISTSDSIHSQRLLLLLLLLLLLVIIVLPVNLLPQIFKMRLFIVNKNSPWIVSDCGTVLYDMYEYRIRFGFDVGTGGCWMMCQSEDVRCQMSLGNRLTTGRYRRFSVCLAAPGPAGPSSSQKRCLKL